MLNIVRLRQGDQPRSTEQPTLKPQHSDHVGVNFTEEVVDSAESYTDLDKADLVITEDPAFAKQVYETARGQGLRTAVLHEEKSNILDQAKKDAGQDTKVASRISDLYRKSADQGMVNENITIPAFVAMEQVKSASLSPEAKKTFAGTISNVLKERYIQPAYDTDIDLGAGMRGASNAMQ